ncbi:uncharacterized protein LOC100899459 [Galendromus occidentalis]|uniref:Uncharacterized protein LOC100899459 n=1 Tax=Galendromus occidentalis TaxID=34638 RepID=A0AAJ6VWW1_9ACAR|nr:uncharacterized protein LOC100899459 [Galendromus occidentalis]
MLDDFESIPHNGTKELSRCWFRKLPHLVGKKKLEEMEWHNSSIEGNYAQALKRVLQVKTFAKFSRDIEFNEEETEIVASRCKIDSKHVADAVDERNMVQDSRRIAAKSPDLNPAVCVSRELIPPRVSGKGMEITSESTQKLLETLCHQVDIPVELPTTSLLVRLFTAVTAIKLPSDLPPLEQLTKLLAILGDEVVHAPLDHIKPADLAAGENEALYDLLEILTTCAHLRDDSVTSTSDEMTTAESCQTSLHSALSSLKASNSASASDSSSSSSSDSLFSSETSCSTCDSASASSSSLSSRSRSTLFSEVTQEIDIACRLCEYLSNHRRVRSSDSGSELSESREQEESSTSSIGAINEAHPPAAPERNPQSSCPLRPSKAQRVNHSAAAAAGKRLEARRALRANAIDASKKFHQTVPCCRNKPPPRKTFPAHNKNVIKPVGLGLKPERMPPPGNGLETQRANGGDEEIVEETIVEENTISPHLVRVLRKQYDQHLQWMKSHGASESGFRKLERDYENLIESHTSRVKQMRAEAVAQNRVSLLKAQKGITHTVRNLQSHAKTQATQLAHVQLEAERLQRSKEAKMRLAEEKLLRETFVESMRIQKEQLLSMKRNLADERYREADKHKIYMQGLEHFYRTQLDMLAETLDKEHRDGELRNSAQMALLRGMRKELKEKLDKEVAFLKDIIASESLP